MPSKRRVVCTDTFRVVIDRRGANVYSTPQHGSLGRHLGVIWIDHTNAWNVKYEPDVTFLPINWVLKLLDYRPQRQLTFHLHKEHRC